MSTTSARLGPFLSSSPDAREHLVGETAGVSPGTLAPSCVPVSQQVETAGEQHPISSLSWQPQIAPLPANGDVTSNQHAPWSAQRARLESDVKGELEGWQKSLRICGFGMGGRIKCGSQGGGLGHI